MQADILTRSGWLFDLDGTLVDSSDGVVRAFHKAQSEFGENPADAAEIRSSIGYPLSDTVARLTQIGYAEFLSAFRAEAMATMHLDSRLLPGVASLLGLLHDLGKHMVLVTSKRRDNAVMILEHLAVAHYFLAFIGDGDDAGPSKPDPAPVRAALKSVGLGERDAVMVGDTRVDIAAGHAAGLPVIGVGSGFESPALLAEADLLVPDARTLQELVASAHVHPER
jgi:HAD superfamily hydrolase (TIGR01509 family)